MHDLSYMCRETLRSLAYLHGCIPSQSLMIRSEPMAVEGARGPQWMPSFRRDSYIRMSVCRAIQADDGIVLVLYSCFIYTFSRLAGSDWARSASSLHACQAHTTTLKLQRSKRLSILCRASHNPQAVAETQCYLTTHDSATSTRPLPACTISVAAWQVTSAKQAHS